MMTIQTIIIVWAALSGAVFSVGVHAEESQVTDSKPSVEWSKTEIIRGSNVERHDIPKWFSRMVPEPREYPPEIQSFVFSLPEVAHHIGKPPRIGRKYACQQPDKSWIFCD